MEVTGGDALNTLRTLFTSPGNTYLNLHTTVNTGGAIRGQLQYTTETSFQFPMSSDQEVPQAAQPPANGLAKVSLFTTRDAAGVITSGTVIFDVNYRKATFRAGEALNVAFLNHPGRPSYQRA
jgi:hypothetical protein